MFSNRILPLAVGILLLTGCSHMNTIQEPATADDFNQVTLKSVYDGDTFYVDISSCNMAVFCQHIPIRVRGVDCPEMKGGTAETKARAKQAKGYSERFLKSGKILLYNCGRDKYFRLLCDVNVNKRDLARELIKNGYGIPYDGGTKTLRPTCHNKLLRKGINGANTAI